MESSSANQRETITHEKSVDGVEVSSVFSGISNLNPQGRSEASLPVVVVVVLLFG